MNIGERIKQFRENRGWTQKSLSRVSGVPQATISKTERGLVKPLFESVWQIAQAFEVGIDALAGIPQTEDEKLAGLAPDVLAQLKSDPALAEALQNPDIVGLLKALSLEFGRPSSPKDKDLQAVLRAALRLVGGVETTKR